MARAGGSLASAKRRPRRPEPGTLTDTRLLPTSVGSGGVFLALDMFLPLDDPVPLLMACKGDCSLVSLGGDLDLDRDRRLLVEETEGDLAVRDRDLDRLLDRDLVDLGVGDLEECGEAKNLEEWNTVLLLWVRSLDRSGVEFAEDPDGSLEESSAPDLRLPTDATKSLLTSSDHLLLWLYLLASSAKLTYTTLTPSFCI